MINTLTHLRYDISGLVNIIKITHSNVQILMEEKNKPYKSNGQNYFEIEDLLPIKNDDEMLNIEMKIQDTTFRSCLVHIIMIIFVLCFIFINY